MSTSSTARTESAGADPAGAPQRPRTVNAALILMMALVVFLILAAIGWLGHDEQFKKLLVDSNKHATKPLKPFGPKEQAHSLHQLRKSQFVSAGVMSVAILFLVFAMTKERAASAGRWGFVVVAVLMGVMFGSFIPISGAPGLLNASHVAGGLCALAALILLFLPASRRYFRECKGAVTAAGGADRPRLRDLFNPGGSRGGATRTASTPRVSTTKQSTDSGEESLANVMNKTRAKTRSDDAAVAKGAQLARQRAKASKSRRTDIGR